MSIGGSILYKKEFALLQEKERAVFARNPFFKKIHVIYFFLGETGAGKSSFINCLIGEDYLPTSLLPNTHVISEIRSSRDSSAYAIVFPIDENENNPLIRIEMKDGDREKFKQELASYVQAMDKKTGRAVYNRAQIYLPCDILEVGLELRCFML